MQQQLLMFPNFCCSRARRQRRGASQERWQGSGRSRHGTDARASFCHVSQSLCTQRDVGCTCPVFLSALYVETTHGICRYAYLKISIFQCRRLDLSMCETRMYIYIYTYFVERVLAGSNWAHKCKWASGSKWVPGPIRPMGPNGSRT